MTKENLARSKRADAALQRYTFRGLGADDTVIIDLLTDIAHWCAENAPRSFEDYARIAQDHFIEESKQTGENHGAIPQHL